MSIFLAGLIVYFIGQGAYWVFSKDDEPEILPFYPEEKQDEEE